MEHSRSPMVHETLLAIAGLEGEYQALTADEVVLRQEVELLRSGERHGLNITMPLKEAAVQFCDRLSPVATRAISVNTLALDQDTVVGHSTDANAFAELFADPRFAPLPVILILGAGGSAAAALATGDGRPIYLSSRRTSQAERLAARLGGKVIPWGVPVTGALVVNATPLGMNGEALPEAVVVAAAGLIDLPYGTVPTPAVTVAAHQGIPLADGQEFLLRQAIESFRLWTGVSVGYHQARSRLRNT